jgi:hypothetical protein
MKKWLCFLVILSLCIEGYCQQKISGMIKDSNHKPISYAIVTIKNSNDSSLIKYTTSTKNGMFEMKDVKAGKYILQIESISYTLFRKVITISSEDINLNEIVLFPDTIMLTDILVKSNTMPSIIRRLDKTIVTIDNTIYSKGDNAYNLLNLIPEVQSDNTGGILFRAEGGVKVYVDGRKIQLSGQELMQYIKSIPSESIKSYEISSISAAENDAENTTAIINIVLKSNYKYGLTGSMFSNFEENRYPVFSEGFLLNYRVGKFNFQTSYNYTNAKNFNDQKEEQYFYNPLVDYEKYVGSIGTFISNNIKGGVDFNITSKQILGANYQISHSNLTSTSNGTNIAYTNYGTPSAVIDSIFTTSNIQTGVLNNQLANIFYRNKFDSIGSRLDMGYTYVNYNNKQTSDIFNQFFYADSVPYRAPQTLYINNPLVIDINTFNFDILKVLKKNVIFKIGSKFEDSKTNNNILYYTGTPGNLTEDTSSSNTFEYDEKILAFYSSYSREYKKLSFNFGLRTEYTDYHGQSVTTAQLIANNGWNLFPSLFLQEKINDNSTINFSYGRSISRPSYEDLNPFERIQDSKYLFEGNPYLVPFYTNSFELSYLLFSKYTFAFEYKQTNNEINNVFRSDGTSDNLIVSTYANSNNLRDYTISASIPVTIAKWWAIRSYGNIRYKEITVKSDTPSYTRQKVTPYIWVNNSFSLPKGYYIDVSGSFLYNAFYSIYDLGPQGAINISARKSFFKNILTVVFNSNDPFNLKRITMNINEATFSQKIQNFLPTRTFSIGLSYQFAKGKKNTNRENIESSNQESMNRL